MPLWHKARAREEATLEKVPARRTWVVCLGMVFNTTATAKLLPSTTFTLSSGCLRIYSSPLLLSSSPYKQQQHERRLPNRATILIARPIEYWSRPNNSNHVGIDCKTCLIHETKTQNFGAPFVSFQYGILNQAIDGLSLPMHKVLN